MSVEAEVRNASTQFYTALNSMINGDAAPLTEIWSHSPTVTTMHPIGGRQVGWDDVRGSWEQVSHLATSGSVELKDQHLHVAGDAAFEVGVEQGRFTLAGEEVAVEHRVTNVYQREDGVWKIVHHHTDASPAMLDVLSRVQKAAGQA